MKHAPQRAELFKPLTGAEWDEFVKDIEAKGIQQPLVVAVRQNGFVVVDGHQRLRAGTELELARLPCLVQTFDGEPDEVRHLVMNNVRRRQLSRQEVDKVILYYLKEFTHWSDRRVAAEVGVSNHTVDKKRQELEATGQITQLDKLEGADGKTRPRKMPKPKPKPKPPPPIPEAPHGAEAYKKLNRAVTDICSVNLYDAKAALEHPKNYQGGRTLLELLEHTHEYLGEIISRNKTIRNDGKTITVWAS